MRIRRRLHGPEPKSPDGEAFLSLDSVNAGMLILPCLQMYSSPDNQYNSYSNSAAFPQYIETQPQIINSIEFTDLTRPQMEDRRRRRSNTTQDKESVSNMRIVSTLRSQTPTTLSGNQIELTISTAPPCPKPSFTTCFPRAQREARPTPRARTRRARVQAPHPREIVHRPRQHSRQTEARSQESTQ